MIDPGCRLIPHKNVHARRFDAEMILLDLEHGMYFELDEVGAAIWEGVASGRSLGEIAESLADVYAASRERILEDAGRLAERLEAAGLVEVKPAGR
jgi:hypothetical protein